jgi:hypothetical protein
MNTCSHAIRNYTEYVKHHHHLRHDIPLRAMAFLGFPDNRIFYRVGLSTPCPTPKLEDQASVFVNPRDRVNQLYPKALRTNFSHLSRHTWARLLLSSGQHTDKRCQIFKYILKPFLCCIYTYSEWLSSTSILVFIHKQQKCWKRSLWLSQLLHFLYRKKLLFKINSHKSLIKREKLKMDVWAIKIQTAQVLLASFR